MFLVCAGQQRPQFDHDSPLGNRLGFGKEDREFKQHVQTNSAEARRVKRNSNGHRILEEYAGNNSISVEVEVDEPTAAGGRRRLQTVWPSLLDTIVFSTEIEMFWDQPNNTWSECAMGLFVRSNKEDAKIYYEFEDVYTQVVADPTLGSAYAEWDSPYIHLNTPFGATRNRSINIVAV